MRQFGWIGIFLVVSVIYTAPAFSVSLSAPSIPQSHIDEWSPAGLLGIEGGSTTTDRLPGENIDMRTGRLMLNVTDVVLPGNGGMNIIVNRSFNKEQEPNFDTPYAGGNWSLDVPKIIGNRTQTVAHTDSYCKNPNPGKLTLQQTKLGGTDRVEVVANRDVNIETINDMATIDGKVSGGVLGEYCEKKYTHEFGLHRYQSTDCLLQLQIE